MLKDPVTRCVQEPDRRLEDRVEKSQGPAYEQCCRHGLSDSENLGGLFSEHDVQKRNGRKCQSEGIGFDHHGRLDFGESKKWLKHARKEGLAEPTQAKTGRCNPDLTRGKIGVQVVLYLLDERRALAAFSGQCVDLAPADFHERKLGRDKEAVQEHQRHHRRQFADQHQRRVPMPRDYVGRRHRHEKVK